ncbi:MAG: hypothetical protein Q7U10_10190 [Thermodesulfovibrionia bacterium]|nr:hypothetical protein [Thermodesulfovibrionia bacterium]
MKIRHLTEHSDQDRLAGSYRSARLCMAAAPEDNSCGSHTKASIILASMLMFVLIFTRPFAAHAVPAGTEITNTAVATYGVGSVINIPSPSNTVSTTTVEACTKSELKLMKYSPDNPNSEIMTISSTSYCNSGVSLPASGEDDCTGSFVEIEPPVPFGSTDPLALGNPVPLFVPDDGLSFKFHAGEPLFIRLIDIDQNLNNLSADSVYVTVSADITGDSEYLRLTETGPATGIFTGYLPSEFGASASQNDGVLTVDIGSKISADYTNPAAGLCAADISSVFVNVDPFGIVFDSNTGLPVEGAIVSMKIAVGSNCTDTFAEVKYDDGSPDYPNPVVTGPDGKYRFPLIDPGKYCILITPPAGYAFPSSVPALILQSLTTDPFTIVTGSRGEVFTLAPGPALEIDIPLDPSSSGLWLDKSASKSIVSLGDFLQYSLNIENKTASLISGVTINDRLPIGFRYQAGSLRIDDNAFPDPVISSDGRTLTITAGNIAGSATVSISYVVEVSAGAKYDKASNTAVAASVSGFTSNIATATVEVKEDLFRRKSTIVGRVIADNCEDKEVEANDGVEGIRIYMEDGTYALTDEEGKYHFEGVEPGTHVVQLDIESMPEKFRVVPCEENSRFAGRSFSQFVDLQGGTMWRADFHFALKPKVRGITSAELTNEVNGSSIDHSVLIDSRKVPLQNLRMTVMLPEGSTYLAGSSMMHGKPLPDPALIFGSLTYRLGDVKQDSLFRVKFSSLSNGMTENEVNIIFTFDTPSEKNQRLVLKGNGSASAETTGLMPGEQWDEQDDASEKPDEIPFLESSWLESAEPGLQWLSPEPGYNMGVPSIRIFIKHDPGAGFKFLHNGKEENERNYNGMTKNNAGTIAVSNWSGINPVEGDNLYEFVTFDKKENETGRVSYSLHYSGPAVKAELVAEESALSADGRTAPVIAVRLFDKDGYPVREGTAGRLSVNSPYELYKKIEAFKNDPLSGLDKEEPQYTAGKDGIAKIMLMPTSSSGEALLKFLFNEDEQEISVWLKPEEREWIVVGLAEGTIGYNTLSGHMENIEESDIKEDLYKDGRVAFFAKGKIQCKWLLTMAYDSERERDTEHDSLFHTIDPDTYYTLYGDASGQQYDAASAEKLYIKIERDKFYAMFGDYNTGMTMTELSRYNRSFNGLKTELQTDNVSLNLFAAETNQGFVKEEIRGDGTSGLYHLNTSKIVFNSEKIVIETRDRFRSEVILETRSFSRHMDYNIDYDAGTIFFREPIFSKDENMNPIFIVVDYEVNDPAAGSEYNYGGRGALKFIDGKIETGATYIHEGQTGNEGDLYGADATLKITDKTTIKAEYASTHTESLADTITGDAYLAEIRHNSEKLDGLIYFRETNDGFGLNQQNTGESGTRKIGADMRYRITESLSINAQAYRQKNNISNTQQDLIEAGADYSAGSYGIRTGLRQAEDTLEDGTVNRSLQATLGGSKAFFDNRLMLRADREQSIGGGNESLDFPTRTTLGADYMLSNTVTLFAEHELADGEAIETQDTRIGMRTMPWNGGSINTGMTREYSKDGTRVFATMGLLQTWKYNDKWSFDGGFDHSKTVINDTAVILPSSAAAEDFSALSLGTTYREEKWTWNWRGEARHSDTEDKYGLLTGIYGEVRKGLGMSAGLQLFTTRNDSGTDTLLGDIRLGAAYRPRNTKWIVLDRLDFYFQEDNGPVTEFSSWKIVNNMNANYKPNRENQISFQYGAKYVKDTFDGISYSGFTDLIGIETRHDITKRWDIGARGSMLHSWNSNQYDYSAGASVGCNVVKNAWISLGYNFAGFIDRDFSAGKYTAKGPFMQFRLKFDQYSMKDIAGSFSKDKVPDDY